MSLGLIYKNQETILEERETYGVPYLVYPLLEETGIVTHAFSTRLGGVSKGPWATMNLSGTRGDDPEAVEENKRRMARALGVRVGDLTYTHQTHTTNVAVVREADRGTRFMETDGMVTNVPGLCLVTFYADCVPLAGSLPGYLLRRLRAPVFRRPGAQSHRAQPLRMEGNRGEDGESHGGKDEEDLRDRPKGSGGSHRAFHLPGLLRGERGRDRGI